jgi:hypothetical protein
VVDFNAETTVAQPAIDITRILLLEARNNAREAIEVYQKAAHAGTDPDTGVMQARVWSFWSEMRSALYRRYKKKEETIRTFDTINYQLRHEDLEAERIIDIFERLNDELDDWKFTRLDGHEVIDTLHMENENKAKRL